MTRGSFEFPNFTVSRGEVVSMGDNRQEFRERETGRLTVSLSRFVGW